MNKHDLAGKPVKELKAIMQNLLLKKAENARLLQDMSSSMGKDLLRRRIEERDAARQSYGKIKVSDRDPRDVVLELHSIQVEERIYTADIARMESPKSIAEAIDKDLEMCKTVIDSKEAKAKTGR